MREAMTLYRYNAKRRGVSFSLPLEVFDEIISASCVYCGVPPRCRLSRKLFCFIYQGIDRVNNMRGYEEGNVVPCCKECNFIKGDRLSHDEMLAVARLLLELRRDRPALPR